MSLDLNYVQKRLSNKGFKKEKGKKHHHYYRFYICGEIQTGIRSRVGGHSKQKYKTLKNSIVKRIYEALYFDSKSQFINFLECPFELEDYQEMLLEKGIINISSCR